jgi:hypothetical protein
MEIRSLMSPAWAHQTRTSGREGGRGQPLQGSSYLLGKSSLDLGIGFRDAPAEPFRHDIFVSTPEDDWHPADEAMLDGRAAVRVAPNAFTSAREIDRFAEAVHDVLRSGT